MKKPLKTPRTPPIKTQPGTSAFHEHFMRLALREAARAAETGEVPAGCVIVARPAGALAPPLAAHVLARAHNQTELLQDPTAHAEMIAITQAAAALHNWRLTDTILYVTKEPCPMCAGAIVLARIPVVVFGVPDPKRGGAVSVFNILAHPNLNHRPEIISGVLEGECREILQGFFREIRENRS
ncbi:MAG: tRNA adenosine(34) deaminase TadA [Kiritimatiellia bacterium]